MEMNAMKIKSLLIDYSVFLLEKEINLRDIRTGEVISNADMIDEFMASEEEEELSACCGAPFYDDTDFCTNCKEHG